jgi:hypothetical protein
MNDEEYQKLEVLLGPGESAEYTVNITPSAAGMYNIKIGDAALSLNVKGPPDTGTSQNAANWNIATPFLAGGLGGLLGFLFIWWFFIFGKRRKIILELPGASSSTGINKEGVISGELSAALADSSFALTIEKGTRIEMTGEITADEAAGAETEPDPSTTETAAFSSDKEKKKKITEKIQVTIKSLESLPPLPEKWVPVSPAYDISGLTGDVIHGIRLDRPARIMIGYESGNLPPVTEKLEAFCYEKESGWQPLEGHTGTAGEKPSMTIEVDHFSVFIAIACGVKLFKRAH